jgi:hypothetical protein
MFLSPHQNQIFIQEKRLIHAEKPYAKSLNKVINRGTTFDIRARASFDQHTPQIEQDLTKKIEKLEKGGMDTAQIKVALKKDRMEMAKAAIDKAFIEEKTTIKKGKQTVQATYLDCINSGRKKLEGDIRATRLHLETKFEERVEQAVDEYDKKKKKTSKKTTTRLQDLPKPRERALDFDEKNQETDRLKKIEKKRREELEKSRKARKSLVPGGLGKLPRGHDYRRRHLAAQKMTSPEGGYIDDYDDGWFGDETDEKNTRRDILTGKAGAADIFNGGGSDGQKAMEGVMEEAKELYEKGFFGDDKFTKEDLEDRMQMKPYLDDAAQYTTFETSKGVIAELLRLTETTVTDPHVKQRYLTHIKSVFSKVRKITSSEDAQLAELYKIKPISEYIVVNPKWKRRISEIEKKTDPDRESGDDVINDYPDWDDYPDGAEKGGEDQENDDNMTMKALQGYLLAVSTVHTDKQMDNDYARAFEMFEEVKGDMFEWEHLEKDSTGMDGDDDGFGLKPYLAQAKSMTKYYRVMGFIAGVQKMLTNPTPPGSTNPYPAVDPEYKFYVEEILKQINIDQSEEAQMAILSTIRSPKEAKEQVKVDVYETLMSSVIAATEQHNLYKVGGSKVPKPNYIEDRINEDPLGIDPVTKKPRMTLEAYNVLAEDIEEDIRQFIDLRVNGKGSQVGLIKNMEKRFNALEANNKKLKSRLYDTDEIKDLRKQVTDMAVNLHKTEVHPTDDLNTAVADEHLKQLTEQEKIYFELSKDLDARLLAIQEQAKGTAPTQTPPVTPTPGVTPKPRPGPNPGPEKQRDLIKENWWNAERVTPVLDDYVGKLTLNTLAKGKKVNLRDSKGKIIAKVPNGSEANRTLADSQVLARRVEGLNFVQVHWKGKAVWVAEEYCYKQGGGKPKQPSKPPVQPPVQPSTPAFASSMDITFNRVKSEVETNPNGSIFPLPYNGLTAGCRVEKLYGAYTLKTTHPETGYFIMRFNSVDEIRKYVEEGRLFQYMAVASLQNKHNWNKLKNGRWKGDVKSLKRTGGYSIFVELDWKRNHPFETGNAKVTLDVAPDGRINYVIRKDNVGPDGQNEKRGFVSDMRQLQSTLSYLRQWSESYKTREKTPTFGNQKDFERRRSELINPLSYDQLAPQIGQKYYFNNYPLNGYAFMTLDWDKAGSTASRNRSVQNPILEVKMMANKTIRWKLLNRTGAGGQWIGTQGNAPSLRAAMAQVETVRRNPATYMRTDARQLYNLGGFGKSLYS